MARDVGYRKEEEDRDVRVNCGQRLELMLIGLKGKVSKQEKTSVIGQESNRQ